MSKEWTMDQVILAPGSASELIAHYRRREQELLEANNRYLERARKAEAALSASPAGVVKPLEVVRHKKRGTTYEVIGVGKMQAEDWMTREFCGADEPVNGSSVDMREVAVYRSTEDGSIWVRPVEEFNDGRFEPARIMSAIEPAGVGVGQQPIGWTWELGIRREATGQIYRWEPQISFHMPETNGMITRNMKALYALDTKGGKDHG